MFGTALAIDVVFEEIEHSLVDAADLGFNKLFEATFVHDMLYAAAAAMDVPLGHLSLQLNAGDIGGTAATLTFYFPGGDSAAAFQGLLAAPKTLLGGSELLASLGDVKFSAVSSLSFEVATFVEVEHRAPNPCGMSATACGDGTCIAANELCDGSISCLSAEDEANCGSIDNSGGIGGLAPPPAPPPPPPPPVAATIDVVYDTYEDGDETYGDEQLQCLAGEFRCLDNTACVPMSVVCDRQAYDCEDNSDELGCDFEPPVITLLGESEFTIAANTTGGAPYADPGATAVDAVDGPVQTRAIGVGAVDLAIAGVYTIEYQAVDDTCDDTPDGSGVCVAYAVRTVTVTNPCADSGAFVCVEDSSPGEPVCSRYGLCNLTFDDSSTQGEGAPAEVFVVVQDTESPKITPIVPEAVITSDDPSFAQGLSVSAAGTVVVTTIVAQNSLYQDAGATAVDTQDGEVSTSPFGVGSVDTSRLRYPDDPSPQPFIVTYSASDNAGNEAPVVRRRVYVVCTDDSGAVLPRCEGDDDICPGAGGVCGVAALSFEEDQERKENEPPTMLPEATVQPDYLRSVEINETQPYVPCTPDLPKSVICEPGVTASDPEEGDITRFVKACGQNFARNGLAGCAIDHMTPSTEPYEVSFEACDSAGICVTRRREVYVKPCCECRTPGECGEGGCPSGTRLCSDGATCSNEDGFCASDLAVGADDEDEEVAVDTAPTITLKTSGVLGNVTNLYKSKAQIEAGYAVCEGAQMPTAELLCDLGATASDNEDGDLMTRLLSCPPADCINDGIGCEGHEFYNPDGTIKKGVTGCVNPGAPFGTEFKITFVVYDRAQPPQRATAARTIIIANPCSALGEEYCDSDNECSTGFATCRERDEIRAQVAELGDADDADEGDIVYPNIIVYGEKEYTFDYGVNYAETQGLFLDPCGADAPVNGSDVIFCGASAADNVDGVLNSQIKVIGIKKDGKEICPIASATSGVCPPGKYSYQYQVSDSAQLQTTSEARYVTIKNKAKVGGSLESQSSATTVEEAEQEAAQFMGDAAYLEVLCQSLLASAPNGTECNITGIAPQPAARRAHRRSLLQAREARRGLLEGDSFALDVQFELTVRSDGDSDELSGAAATLGSDIAATVNEGNLTSKMRDFAERLNLDVAIPQVAQGLTVETEVQSVDESLAKWAQSVAEAYGFYQGQLDNTKAVRDASSDTLAYQAASANAEKFQRGASDAYLGHLENAMSSQEAQAQTAQALIASLDELQQVLTALALGNSQSSAIEGVVQEAARLQSELRRERAEDLTTTFVGDSAEVGECARHDADDLTLGFNVSSYELFNYSVVSVDYVYDPSLNDGADTLLERYLQLTGAADEAADAAGGEAALPAAAPVAAANASTPDSRRKLLRGAGGGARSNDGEGGLARVNLADGKRVNVSIAELRELQSSGYLNLGTGPTEPQLKRAIGGTNRLLAGMVVHQTRVEASIDACSSRRFDNLGTECRSGRYSSSAFGVDPVFLKGTQLYEASLQAAKSAFYNLNESSGETFGEAQTPFGFFAHQLKGYRDGFWVLFDSSFTRLRFYEIVLYLDEGGFIDASTKTLRTAFYFYNAESSTFVNYAVTFDFVPGGYIILSEDVQALPVNLYQSSAHYGRAALEVIVALMVAYLATGRLRKLAAEISERGSFTGGLLYHLKDPKGLLDDLIAALLVGSMIVWWAYVFSYLMPLQVEPRYSVYDDLSAAARYLLRNREGFPSGESRYDKPLDPEEILLFEGMVSTLDTMSNLLTTYFTLCGLVLLLGMVRVLMLVHFQPQFKRTTLTLVRSATNVSYVVALIGLVLCMFASTAVIVFGDRIIYFRTIQDSVMYFFTIVLGEIGVTSELARLKGLGAVSDAEYWVGFWMVVIYSVLQMFIVANFLLAELGDAFVDVRGEMDDSTMPDDKATLITDSGSILKELGWGFWHPRGLASADAGSKESAPPLLTVDGLHAKVAAREAALVRLKRMRSTQKRRATFGADEPGLAGALKGCSMRTVRCLKSELGGLTMEMGIESDSDEEEAMMREISAGNVRLQLADGSSWLSRSEIVACLCTLQASALRAIVSEAGSGDAGPSSHPLQSALDRRASGRLGTMAPAELAEMIAERVLRIAGKEYPEYEEEKRQQHAWVASKELAVAAQTHALANIARAQKAVMLDVHSLDEVREAATVTIQKYVRGWRARKKASLARIGAAPAGSAGVGRARNLAMEALSPPRAPSGPATAGEFSYPPLHGLPPLRGLPPLQVRPPLGSSVPVSPDVTTEIQPLSPIRGPQGPLSRTVSGIGSAVGGVVGVVGSMAQALLPVRSFSSERSADAASSAADDLVAAAEALQEGTGRSDSYVSAKSGDSPVVDHSDERASAAMPGEETQK